MQRDLPLTIASLLSIALFLLHIAEDVVRGIEPGRLDMLGAITIMVVWLYGTVALAGQRSGYVVMTLGALLGSLAPVSHMVGVGLVGGRIAGSGGMLLWTFTLLALGVTANFALILAVLRLWHSRKGAGAA